MLRIVMILVVALVAVAVLSGSRRMRRVLWILAGVAILYTILKLTGVVDGIAPGRSGVS
jgi:hypothetical protein